MAYKDLSIKPKATTKTKVAEKDRLDAFLGVFIFVALVILGISATLLGIFFFVPS